MANKQYPVPFASSPGSGGGGGGSGTVTSVGLTVNSTSPSGIFTVTGSPVTTSGTLNVNLAGTSGGVAYFSSGTVVSSSGQLANNAVVLGGGAGAAPKTAAGFTTDGTSQLTLGVATTSTGALNLTGATSGTAIITAQATAGTPTLTLPNASGTFAISASAPLVLSATTGALTAPTAVTSAASLTSNAIVLGAGGQATATNTAFITNGTTTLTVGIAGGGNGVLALSGNTSGTCTLTAPATAGTITNAASFSNSLNVLGTQLTVGTATSTSGVLGLTGSTSGTCTFTAPATAGTTTNPVASSNVISGPAGTAASPTFQLVDGGSGTGLFSGGTNVGLLAAGGNNIVLWAGTPQARLASNGIWGWNSTSGNALTTAIDTGISRGGAAGVIAFGTGAALSKAALLQSGMSVFVSGNFTTSGVGTALEAITGLSISVPAVALNWTFHAHLSYSQNVGNAAVAFGVQAATNNPTNIFAQGTQQITVGPPATFTTGTLATLATTTATNVVSGTPTATATNYVCDIYGTLENPASANAFKILVSTATAADTVTILRGSYLHFNC